jgi:hypothetical protein
LKLRYDERHLNVAVNFKVQRPYATAPRRAVRPYVVKLTTPMTSVLAPRGLASTSTLGNVHVQLAQGGRASHSCFLQLDRLLGVPVCRHTFAASMQGLT